MERDGDGTAGKAIFLWLLFFAVVTPIGIALRLAGVDLLRIKQDPKAQSYWIDRRN